MRPGEALRVSVIIPSYNAAAFLSDALDGALSQDFPLEEVIVVDDGSTDDTPAVARRYGARIRYIFQANGGIGAARNAGLALASGNCIAFLDADDIWTEGSMRGRATLLAERPDVDVVFGMTEHFFTPGLAEEARSRWHCPAGALPVRLASACLIRRHVFERIGNFSTDLTCAEMVDWIARARDAGIDAAQINVVVLRRRIHGDNTVIAFKNRRGDYLRALKASLDRRRTCDAVIG